ncbi:MAG: hypothetical protein CMN66_07305 [Sphingomonadaceae bacterium]|nr:hypothetical protein [Sphingomonadaceae bacterium]
MRTSASNGWVSRNRVQGAERVRPAVRFTRADFRNFDGVPEGFSRLADILSDQGNAPDSDLIVKARQTLADERGIAGLAGLRLAKGFSQKELADLIGTSQPRLSTWESGSEKPGFESIKRLRNALRVSADQIVDALDA